MFDPFGDRMHPGPGAAFVVLVAFLLSFLLIRTSARLTRSVQLVARRRRDPRRARPSPRVGHRADAAVAASSPSPRRSRRRGGTSSRSASASARASRSTSSRSGCGSRTSTGRSEGRASFDAVVCSLAFAALVVLGTRPFGLDEPLSIWGTIAVVARRRRPRRRRVRQGPRAARRDRAVRADRGGCSPPLRLARPASPWARWRYDAAKRRRARGALRTPTRPAQRLRRRSATVAGRPAEVQP